MPYIKNSEREKLEEKLSDLITTISKMVYNNRSSLPGVMNYVITSLISRVYFIVNYSNINEIVGFLECSKMEFYRRIAAPYEEQKIAENGDVYE